MSESVTVKILPNKNESTLAEALPLLIKIIAIPKLNVRTMTLQVLRIFYNTSLEILLQERKC